MFKNAKLVWPYSLLLFICVVYTLWYPYVALGSITHYVGNGYFKGGPLDYGVQLQTYLGALAGIILLTYFIMKQEGFERKYLPFALIASYLAVISITMWYEQTWVGIGTMCCHYTFWGEYYGGFAKFSGMLADLSIVFVLYPWIRAFQNQKYFFISIAIYFGFFLVWVLLGYRDPTVSLDGWIMNSLTRIMSDIVPVTLVFIR